MSGIHLIYVPMPITAAAGQAHDRRCRRPTLPLPPQDSPARASKDSPADVQRDYQDNPVGATRQSGTSAAAARQSSMVIARQSAGCPTRLSRQSGRLRETVRRDRRHGQQRTIWPPRACRARCRQPSQHKSSRHGRGCAPWPVNTACHPSRSPATVRKSHRR
jgi:hypothetical protein